MEKMGKKASIGGGVVATILHFLLKLFVFIVGSKHSNNGMQHNKNTNKYNSIKKP
jgi:hypothetical protein